MTYNIEEMKQMAKALSEQGKSASTIAFYLGVPTDFVFRHVNIKAVKNTRELEEV